MKIGWQLTKLLHKLSGLLFLAHPVHDHIHRVREKKRPHYSRHNFDKFSHSFVIFGMNHPDTSTY